MSTHRSIALLALLPLLASGCLRDVLLPPDGGWQHADFDGDGWCAEAPCIDEAAQPGDCDDTDATRHPEAVEACDGLDGDCDGAVPADEQDADSDGWVGCEGWLGTDPAITGGGDCDDTDAALTPQDADGDGWSSCAGDCDDADATAVPADADGDGVTDCNGDCDDEDPLRTPGADELCDGIDNDCDGVVPADESDADTDGARACEGDCDDADAAQHPFDVDGDGASPCEDDCDDSDPALNTLDDDGDGASSCDGDCDDGEATALPGGVEVCDGIDNDCTGGPDDGLSFEHWWPDLDQDGWGDAAAVPVSACAQPAGSVDNDGDCDDLSWPLNADDADGDGESTCAGDCDDADSLVHTGAAEQCDGQDNDCDGVPGGDEGDADGDGVRPCDGDCDDLEAASYPSATEVCDGLDNDCDSAVPIDETDDDGDGLDECAGLDCDDAEAARFPGNPEVCDGLDNDCDLVVPVDEVDGDGDSFIACTECDDAEPARFPGNPEVCDELDNDCDLSVPADEVDGDADGWTPCGGDCADGDSATSPGAVEVHRDGIDQDCDGADTIDDFERTDGQPVGNDWTEPSGDWSISTLSACGSGHNGGGAGGAAMQDPTLRLAWGHKQTFDVRASFQVDHELAGGFIGVNALVDVLAAWEGSGLGASLSFETSMVYLSEDGGSSIASAPITLVVGDWYTLRVAFDGETLSAWAYAVGDAEPATPTVSAAASNTAPSRRYLLVGSGVGGTDTRTVCVDDVEVLEQTAGGEGACVHLLERDDSLTIDVYSSNAQGDMDGDGDVDLVVIGTGNNIVLHTNTGSGFTQQSLATVAQPGGVGIGDLDNDGDVDIVHGLGNAGGGRILRNDGGGVFIDAGVQFGGGDRCDFEFYRIAPVDIDNDGMLELVTGVDCGVNVFENDGSLNFNQTTSSLIASGSATQGFVTEDIDGDGYVDVVGAVKNGAPPFVLINDQAGSFTVDNSHTMPTHNDGKGTAAADLDGDGDIDIYQADTLPGGELELTWIENQAGTLVERESWPTGLSYGGALDIGDFDGDGDPDVVVASLFSGGQIFENDGTGAVEPGPLRPGGVLALLLDFEGDGDDDLVLAESGGPPVLYSGGCYDELVAFTSDRDGGADWDIWITDIDQTTFQQLTDLAVLEDHPKISPDGERVAYQSEESGSTRIHLVEVATLTTTQLTDSSTGCSTGTQPTWYSDGSAVLYECYTTSGNSRARKVDITTGADSVVWDTPGSIHPSIGPQDGQVACVFDNGSASTNRYLKLLDIASGVETPLSTTQDGHWDSLPTWTPDGSWIVWARSDSGSGHGTPVNLYRIDAAGAGMQPVTTHAGGVTANYARPSPTGDEVIYGFESSGHWSIRVVALDGSYDVEWLNETGDISGPDWRLLVDEDGDGFVPPVDCDDADATTYPGAYELCDGLDNDCDGITEVDADGDGWPSCFAGDCDDTDDTAYPGAPGDGACMVEVPSGSFWMGCAPDDTLCATQELPGRDVTLDTFFIDQTEVTVEAYAECVTDGDCTTPHPFAYDCNWGVTGLEAYPINCVDWTQAEAYCDWTGKRLPTEAEWEKAARGTDQRIYPWGEATPDCAHAHSDDCAPPTLEVGSLPLGASPYGALDMAGNVDEWAADWYEAAYFSNSPPADNPPGPTTGTHRLRRGGNYLAPWGNLRTSQRGGSTPAYYHAIVGFRCASSPCSSPFVSDADTLGLWHFDDGSGPTAADDGPLGNNGDLSGATWTTDGRFDGALEFDGSTNSIDSNVVIDIDSSESFTVEAWVYQNGSTGTWQSILGATTGAASANKSNVQLRIRHPDNTVEFGVRLQEDALWWADAEALTPLTTGHWTHVRGVYDDHQLSLFIDGQLAATNTLPYSGTILNPNTLRVGAVDDTLSATGNIEEFFWGSIDEVRVSTTAREGCN
jgi:formylglycine-generating enzyme required for sulfatase activity/Tol biopolymer transport system component